MAGEILHCGTPEIEDVPLTSDTHDVCDIYTRQFEYREEFLEYQAQLRQRQENFARARQAAVKNYKAELQALNDSR